MGLDMRWNLDALYQSFEDEKFKKDMEDFRTAVSELTAFAEGLRQDGDPLPKLEEYVNRINELDRFNCLSWYTQLIISVDAENEQAQKMDNAIENIFTDLTKPDVLFRTFLTGIEDLDGPIERSELLKQHAFALREMKMQAGYDLPEAVETAVAKLATTGSSAWGNMKEQLFALLTAEVPMEGEKKRLPLTAVRNLAYVEKPEVRKAAFEAEITAYDRISTACAAALNGIKGEVLHVTKMRGYASPLDMTLLDSRMERATLDAMFAAMEDYFPAFRQYFRKKAEMLGYSNGLPFYDLFAPVPGGRDMQFSYDEAADFVVRQFTAFSKKMGGFARNAFDNGWVDAEMREGKRGGAFCENMHYLRQSRIMANFGGSFNDVCTLAHELGHAYHGDCLNDETYLNSSYTMPIAETASTFCETLICDAALRTAAPEEALTILENDISSAAQVIVDIYSRFLFEDEVIRRRVDGPLSVNELKEVMMDSQRKAYGNGLDPNMLHPFMWICKPHYYYADSNYYNFPYAYGQLFSKGLYAEYLKKGDAFIETYDRLLAATGKHTLEEVGDLAGVNVREKAFWAGSLELYKQMIDRFCGYGA